MKGIHLTTNGKPPRTCARVEANQGVTQEPAYD
jgi:hypothetical protein